MRPEDLILVSVDDHVVEPATMFDQHLPAQYKAQAPRVVRKKDGSDVWVFQGEQIPNIGSERRRRPPARRVRHGADLLRAAAPRHLQHPRTHPRHERQRRARLDVLPVVPRPVRRAVLPAGRQAARACHPARLQRLAHRRMVRRLSRAASSRSACCRSGTRSSWPTRSGASPRRAATPSPSRRAPMRSACRACTTRTGTRSGRPAPTRAPSSASTSAPAPA